MFLPLIQLLRCDTTYQKEKKFRESLVSICAERGRKDRLPILTIVQLIASLDRPE